MNHNAYQRLVIGYHGCDAKAARDVLRKNGSLKPSENDYDWLGHGIYFWEHGPARALEWAQQHKTMGRIEKPSVVGAVLHLGNCFDLLDTHFTDLLGHIFPSFRKAANPFEKQAPIPVNAPAYPQDSELLLRRLDCAMINWTIRMIEETNPDQPLFQTVRASFRKVSLRFLLPPSGASPTSRSPSGIRLASLVTSVHPKPMSKHAGMHESRDLKAVGREIERRVREMSPAERLQTLVDAGIFTAKGNPTKPYRGVFRKISTATD